MIRGWIILWLSVTAAGCRTWPPAQPPAMVFAPPPVAMPYPTVVPGTTVIVETETIETFEPMVVGPMIPQQVPAPTMVPQHVYPIAPLYPSGPIHPPQPGWVSPPGSLPPGAVPGGLVSPTPQSPYSMPGTPTAGIPSAPPAVTPPPNPILVPVANDEFAWEQIADVTSDYFRISREVRARRGAGITSEGFIETAPQGGATVLEPHRRDSVGSFNLWESTLQTIRRRCLVRVTPDAGGYLVGVEVLKELEDLPRPEQATAGASTIRTDGSLPPRESYDVSRTAESVVWIPLGRDVALEQQMLAEIHARLAGPVGGQPIAAR